MMGRTHTHTHDRTPTHCRAFCQVLLAARYLLERFVMAVVTEHDEGGSDEIWG